MHITHEPWKHRCLNSPSQQLVLRAMFLREKNTLELCQKKQVATGFLLLQGFLEAFALVGVYFCRRFHSRTASKLLYHILLINAHLQIKQKYLMYLKSARKPCCEQEQIQTPPLRHPARK